MRFCLFQFQLSKSQSSDQNTNPHVFKLYTPKNTNPHAFKLYTPKNTNPHVFKLYTPKNTNPHAFKLYTPKNTNPHVFKLYTPKNKAFLRFPGFHFELYNQKRKLKYHGNSTKTR